MSKKIDLSGELSYVTGGSRGIGRACMEMLAEAGSNIAFCSTQEQGTIDAIAEEIAASYGVEALAIRCDVTQPEQIKHAFKILHKRFGRLDVFVNNAGVMHTAPLAMTTTDSIRNTMDVNVTGALLNLQFATKLMARKKSGSVINIGSIVGSFGSEGQIAYSASKAAVIGITKAAAKEFGAQGIRVNAVAPGFIDTELLSEFDTEAKQRVIRSIKMNRIGTTEDVAHCVLFLASPMSAYITGQTLGVDGGMLV